MNDPHSSDEKRLRELEEQARDGSLFTHQALSDLATTLKLNTTSLRALIKVLQEKGILDSDDLDQEEREVSGQMLREGEFIGPGVVLRKDGPPRDRTGEWAVNCEERLHICKAVCCQLGFPLTKAEVESGKVKWELGRPYFLRQDKEDRYCVHLRKGDCQCSIYQHRPQACSDYSCARDPRIWTDFENMVLNEEWIEKTLEAQRSQRLTPPEVEDGHRPRFPK